MPKPPTPKSTLKKGIIDMLNYAGAKKMIYIAGPYTSDPEGNVLKTIAFADILLEHDFVPFIPHLSHYWEQHSPKHYDHWMEYNLHFVSRCDALFRIFGHSPGADKEVEFAKKIGKPIFNNLSELIKWREEE
jgi:hypothetical protein